MLRRSYAKIALFLLGIAAVSAACNALPTEDEIDRASYGYFQTAVAAPGRNYDGYWLGRSFEAGGLTFEGPYSDAPAGSGGIGADIGLNDADGLGVNYLAKTAAGAEGPSDISMTLYSRQGWDDLQDLRRRGAQPRLEVKQVDIHGWPAELKTNFYRPGDIAARILVVVRERTVIEVTTGAMRSSTPGAAQLNPLIDEATFLAAMQNLRPYPE